MTYKYSHILRAFRLSRVPCFSAQKERGAFPVNQIVRFTKCVSIGTYCTYNNYIIQWVYKWRRTFTNKFAEIFILAITWTQCNVCLFGLVQFCYVHFLKKHFDLFQTVMCVCVCSCTACDRRQTRLHKRMKFYYTDSSYYAAPFDHAVWFAVIVPNIKWYLF